MTTVDDRGLVFAGAARQEQSVRDRRVPPLERLAHPLAWIGELDTALNAFRVVPAEQAMAEAAHMERRRTTRRPAPIGHRDGLGPNALARIPAFVPLTAPRNHAGRNHTGPFSRERKTRWHTLW